ncbi:MAG: hypothetical protein H7256_14055 [Bdellovibrio sp.]|nr:hypothetical protein [Bdellovibrio sp.]
MKKKMVSLFVFVMLVAGFQARAQEGVVDKGVSGVENVDFTYVCKADDENSSVILKVKDFSNDKNVLVGNISVENGESLGLSSSYLANVDFKLSFLYSVTTYNFLDENKNYIAEFSISKMEPGMTRGVHFCGRAGCDMQPQPLPLISKGLLKIYEKEIPFTCQ